LTRAIAELSHLRHQRDNLQTYNTQIVDENSVLRADLKAATS
jgi:hypothetical protein